LFFAMNTEKCVFITGCTRGLGRAMIPEFIQRGWRVVGCGRDAQKIADLQAEYGSPHWFEGCDLADDGAVEALCERLVVEAGLPDLVLNNAAIVNASAPLWEVSAAEFSQVIDINLKGPASVMRALLPAMLKRGSGVIVNFSSGWGRSTSPEVAPYCATKFGIEGLSMAAAQETGGKVAILPLNPGIIDTQMLRSCFGSGAAHYPGPEAWAQTAVPFLIGLGPKDNGRPLTAPGG
jgi:NAD(P)-dependent dehydrogenase (short-subunit alcohol dehydrogenase family)